MKFFELTFIVEDSQEERLAALAKRFGKVNGWGEKDTQYSCFERQDDGVYQIQTDVVIGGVT